MNEVLTKLMFRFSPLLLIAAFVLLKLATAQASPTDVVLYASEATARVGNWAVVSDTTAAGGARLANADLGGLKLALPLPVPASYFEMSFNAQSNTPYRLWIRGKAQDDSPYNDSIFVQFDGSVTAGGSAVYRIGTNDGTCINLEEASGYGLSGWGWQDNGWGVNVMGPLIYFANTGVQTLRIQPREDGLSIDQIVLSPATYLNSAPGALKNDTVILPKSNGSGGNPAPTVSSITPNSGPTTGGTSVTISGANFMNGASVTLGGTSATGVAVNGTTITLTTPSHAAGTTNVVVTNPDNQSATLASGFTFTAPPLPPPPAGASTIVIWASDVPNSTVYGSFSKVYDATAAGTTALQNPDAGGAKLAAPLTSPSSYFEVSFNVQSNTAYHLWVRGKAIGDSPYNDSFFAQFSGSVDATGSPVFRIGTASGTCINLEEAAGYGLSGWGWQDNGWGVNVMGSNIYFASTGQQTLRLQPREDGFSIDQIVLSPSTYLNTSPGLLKNDTVILASTLGGGTPPPPPPPPVNLPPVVTVSANPTAGVAPLAVSFSQISSDPDGSIASYSWTFGDGQNSTQPYPSHTYSSAGTYTARLTVTDNQGATASATVVITANPPTSGGVTFKVMTWNSQFNKGTDNIQDLDRQATWIANMGADVVGMYELPVYPGDDHAQQMRNLLNQKTGANWSYYWIGKFAGCTEGNLILSKWPIISTNSIYLSYQRSVAQATINVNGRLINFFTTHLDPDSTAARMQQVSELKNFASNFAEPRIIVGDFNFSPDWPEMPGMTSSYYDGWNEAFGAGTAAAYPDNPVEWQTRTRRGRIDYIFYSRGASTLTLRATQIPDQRNLSQTPIEYIGTTDDRGVRPSDHNFMTATFNLQ
jgi:endonuclease/exonuclease/phosphatase family metal-dependent hydrolase